MVEGTSLYCFDTFTGFPEISVQKELGTTGHAVSVGTFSDTSQAKVEHAIAGRTSPPCLVLRVGEFPATFAGLEDRQWRFVLLDADLYAPIKAGLEMFWPRLVPGGFILCHDYLFGYPGVRKAADEFFDPLGIVPVPWPDRVGTAVVGKSWNAVSNP
jgi:O-methyltransferase